MRLDIFKRSFERTRLWLAVATSWRLGFAIGALVALFKLPLLYTTLGEDDQGRLIMDALSWLHDGPSMLHPYGIFTSPLWTLPLAGIASVFGNSQLVILTNVGGWLCGGLTTALAFVLLEHLGASRAWSASGALATALIPGMFYLSLYGYPSQYALPLLLASAVAFVSGFGARTARATSTYLALTGIAFCALALMKVDFALAGSFLFSLAVVQGRVLDRRTLLLPAFAVVGAAVVYVVSLISIDGRDLIGFLKNFESIHPWEQGEVFGASSVTVFYACGFGTLALWLFGLIAGVVRGRETGRINRIVVATVIGVAPLWVFWLARPPMSTRHAVPGALMIAIFAALMASRVLKGVRYAPLVWLVALVAINWPFGNPKFDVNYHTSGNLARAAYVNRKAFAVCDRIADRIVRGSESIKVVIGPRRWDEFGGIDFVPTIEVELARRSRQVKVTGRSAQGGLVRVYTHHDGSETMFVPYLPSQRAVTEFGNRDAAFYTTWTVDLRPLRSAGLPVLSFEPEEMYKRTPAPGIYRLLD